jgi:hypothetical protein
MSSPSIYRQVPASERELRASASLFKDKPTREATSEIYLTFGLFWGEIKKIISLFALFFIFKIFLK